MAENYNETLNLLKSKFDMRAGLANKEPQMLEKWLAADLYNEMMKNNDGKPLYILHDGPPYANASIHMGTALNKVLKDIIVRYKNIAGFKAPYVPGWDTHGLPIERKALEKLGEKRKEISSFDLRQMCREYAERFVNVQKEQFMRLGSIGNYADPYLTYSPWFESRQIDVFGEMAKKGYIYRGLKPVYWCPSDHTALAEAEIEYEDDSCDSIYVGFNVSDDNGTLAKAGMQPENVWFVIWTTTTWTLPGNVAVCLGANLQYVAVKVEDRFLIVAKDLLEASMADCKIENYEIVAEFSGSELENIQLHHCYLDKKSLVILGNHVTTESGTGCVHTAPGHGVDDFNVVQNYPSLEIVVPVDDNGVLTELAGRFEGLFVDKANKAIEEYLTKTGHVLGKKHLVHSYPHCWRCHSKILFRATEQWFCSVQDFKDETFKAIENVEWIPSWGKERMMGMVRDRNDWCISRQRLWGVPIPAFHCNDCGEYLITDETISAVSALFAKEGSDAWYKYSAKEILPKDTVCPKCGGSHWEKETDTMDVWFDSGSSHASVLERYQDHSSPADLYLEGSDQFRGWFQSSLLTSVATKGIAPYKSVVSCGWVVDGQGRKMSKSLGNGIEPEEIININGADIVRLWVASTDYQVDVRISQDMIKQLSESYRKIRNTSRFLITNVGDFNPITDAVPFDELPSLDKWALAEFDKLVGYAHSSYDKFEFHKVYHSVLHFCVVEMSNFYLDIIKDRLYISNANSKERRSAQTVMFNILRGLTQIISPILCFTSQEIWDFIPDFEGKKEFIVLHEMPKSGAYSLNGAEAEKWRQIIAVTDDVKKVLEEARAKKEIGASLEAAVVLSCDEQLHAFVSPILSELADIFIVSEVLLEKGNSGTIGDVKGLAVRVKKAEGEKCVRCWQYKKTVGSNEKHAELCGRCADIVEEIS